MLGIDTIKEIVTNPKEFFGKNMGKSKKLFSSLAEGIGGAWHAQWGEKLKIFVSKFKEEWDKLDEEKEEISEEAKAKAEKTVEETMKDFNESVKLDESKVTDKGAADTYKEASARLITSEKSLSPNQQVHASKAVEKLTKALKEGKSDNFSKDEFKAVSGTVLMALKELKEKYPDKEKLEAAMKQISDTSDCTDYSLKKLLTGTIWKILNPGLLAGMSIASDLGVGFFSKPGFVSDMALFKEKELKPKDEQTLCDTMHKYVLQHTSDASIKKVITIVRSVSPKEDSDKVVGVLPLEKVAEIVSLVHVEDFIRLIKIFTGKSVPAGAAPDEKVKANT